MPQTLFITQGEYATGSGSDIVISTLLGSCVSCCLWDPIARIGGMNHMLLAVSGGGETRCALSGINAMEVLINDLVKLGVVRRRLQAKVFGGARMISGFSDIGAKNAAFTLSYLEQEGIPLIAKSLGGNSARNLRFWPGKGRAMQKMTNASVPDVAVAAQGGNGVELF